MDHVPTPSAMTTHSPTTDFETAMSALLPVKAEPETETETELVHLPSMCRYTSKRCYSVRAVKRNGKLHNLCELHRLNANNNQRRLELRRRLQGLRGVSERVGGHRRASTSTRKPRPLKASVESPASYHNDHSRTWKSAATMTVEDMARILADDADSLCQGLRVAPVLFSVHDVDSETSSSSSSALSCASDTDDSDDSPPRASPLPRFSGWGPRHSLDFCDADAEMAAWATTEALGLDAFAAAPWVESVSQATDTTSGWTNDMVTPSFPVSSLIL